MKYKVAIKNVIGFGFELFNRKAGASIMKMVFRTTLLFLLGLAIVAGYSSPVAANYSDTIEHPKHSGLTLKYTINGADITDVQQSTEEFEILYPETHPEAGEILGYNYVVEVRLSGTVQEGDTITIELYGTDKNLPDYTSGAMLSYRFDHQAPSSFLDLPPGEEVDGSLEVTLSHDALYHEDEPQLHFMAANSIRGGGGESLRVHGTFEVIPEAAPVTGADEGDPPGAAPPLTIPAAIAASLAGLAAAAAGAAAAAAAGGGGGGGGGGGAAGTTGAAASPFADEVVTTVRSDESTYTPSDSSRTDEEIVDDPRLGDRVVDVNGEEHIYTTRPNDDAGPGWQSVEDYEREQRHREQGHIYRDGTWWTPEGHQQHESSLSQHRQDAAEDLKQRHQEAAEERRRSEIKREVAEKEAEHLESIAEQVKSGRHSLSDSDNAKEFVERLEEAGKHLRETGEYSEIDEDIIERTFDRVRPEMEQMQGETYEELDRAQRSARNWDRATWAAEKAEEYATASVDKLAKVTGPAGRKVQTAYHGVKTVAGGLAEGHATSEYGRSIANVGADVVESRLSGWKKNAFNIGRGATESAHEAYQEGESITRSAFEGAAGQASEIAGKSVKGTFGDVGKYIYDYGESAVQGGYENYLEADEQLQELSQRLEAGEITESEFEKSVSKTPSIREGMERGAIEQIAGAGVDAVVDHTVGGIGEQIMPEGAVSELDIQKHMNTTRGVGTSEGDLDELVGFDWFTQNLKEKAGGDIQDWVKDSAKDRVSETDIYKGIHGD